jgi:hypothetical protein
MADDLHNLFDPYNRTELHQLCQANGIRIARDTPREEMVRLLLGEATMHPDQYSDLDEWRHAIMGFVLDHWDRLSTQLTCPAKSGDPKACFGCVDSRVQYCLDKNERYLPQIRLHRKKEAPNMSNETTLATCPRDVEGILRMSFADQRRILEEVNPEVLPSTKKRQYFSIPAGPQRAEFLLEILREHDKLSGGAPAAAPKAAPAAAAAEQAAPAAPAETTKTAKRGRTAKAKPDLGAARTDADAAAQAPATGATQVVDLTPVMDMLTAMAASIEALRKKVDANHTLTQSVAGSMAMLGAMTESAAYFAATAAAMTLQTDPAILAEDTRDNPERMSPVLDPLRELGGSEPAESSGKG